MSFYLGANEEDNLAEDGIEFFLSAPHALFFSLRRHVYYPLILSQHTFPHQQDNRLKPYGPLMVYG